MGYINREELYEKTVEWETQALHMVEKTMYDEDLTEWRKWSIILNERSAFKFDIADMPAADVEEVIRCKECVYWNAETKGCKRNPSVQPWYENDFCNYRKRLE